MGKRPYPGTDSTRNHDDSKLRAKRVHGERKEDRQPSDNPHIGRVAEVEMKAFVHIGLPKNGSTSIQSWMSSNREAIEAGGVRNLGAGSYELICATVHVAMSELGLDEKTAWTHYRKIIKSEQRDKSRQIYADLTENLGRMKPGPGIFVCSNEHIFMQREFHIRALDMYLSRFFEDRTYVVYIRDTIDLFTSLYSQQIRNLNFRFCMDFESWLDKCVNDPRPNCAENYFDRLFVWDEVVGKKLNVRLLETEWLTNGDLIDDFSSLIGIGPFSKPARLNESFAAEYIEYIRQLNGALPDAFPRQVRDRANKILQAASEGKSKLSVSDEQARSIRESLREREEKIRKRYFPDRPFLFSPKSRGEGVTPMPLSDQRKVEIESEIRQKMTANEWELYSQALQEHAHLASPIEKPAF